jgi:nucleotide-binding universal stress UspA family protein
MIKISRILVATDFGDASAAALAYGRELARTFGGRLDVMHAVETPMMMAGADAVSVDLTRLEADLRSQAHRALGEIVTAEDRAQLRAETAVRSGRSAANEIVAYAKETAADLIVIGTHGRGFMGHLLMGSVAEKVVRMAPCPVLTVHHPEREFIAPDALQAVESRGRR